MNPTEDSLTQPDGLADRLRAIRTQAGLSGKELAERNSWQPSKVSRLENGKQMPAPADLTAWARACNAGEAEQEDLLRLLAEVQAAHHDWKRRMRRGQAAVPANYNELVQSSRPGTALRDGLHRIRAYSLAQRHLLAQRNLLAQ